MGTCPDGYMRIGIYVPKEYAKVLKHITVEKNTTMSDIVRKLIDDYLQNYEDLNQIQNPETQN